MHTEEGTPSARFRLGLEAEQPLLLAQDSTDFMDTDTSANHCGLMCTLPAEKRGNVWVSLEDASSLLSSGM